MSRNTIAKSRQFQAWVTSIPSIGVTMNIQNFLECKRRKLIETDMYSHIDSVFTTVPAPAWHSVYIHSLPTMSSCPASVSLLAIK